jgi:hypothetical protein
VTLLGILPLPGTDLGRDAELEITAGGKLTEMQGGGKMAETLRIDAYNYRGGPLPKEQWSSERIDEAWGGYCILAADTSEFVSVAAFDAHLGKSQIECIWDADKGQLNLSWTLDGTVLACEFLPSGTAGQPTTNLLPSRTVNGKWLYLPPELERECDLSAIGRGGRLEKNGAVFNGEPGRMGALMTDPTHGIYEVWNPFPEPASLALTIPSGARVEPLGEVGITRITVFAREDRVQIDGAVSGPGRATDVALTGFPPDVRVRWNGQSVPTRTGQHNGDPALLVSLVR